MRNVYIWGGLGFGEFVVKQVQNYFLEWEIKGIIDSNEKLHGTTLLGYKIIKPEYEIFRQADLLIVCSSRYCDEIVKNAVNEYGCNPDIILCAESKWPIDFDINPRLRWEKLMFKPYIQKSAYMKMIVEEIKNAEGELNRIGIECGTDKASIATFQNGFRLAHDYLRHYDDLFQNYRKEKIVLLELGCGTGSSLKMWKRYFENAKIVGVDINDKAIQFKDECVDIVIGNAAYEDTISELKEIYKKFDIIIDDASHAWGDMRTSFEGLWDSLKRGGFYILEDINCGSQGAFQNYPPVVWDAQSIFDYVLDRTRIMAFCRDWNPEYNRYHFEFLPEKIKRIERELDSVMLIHGVCIIKKR